MDEAPKLHHVLVPIVAGGFFGIIIGSILIWNITENKQAILVSCIMLGCVFGFWLSRWFLGKREDFFYYEYNASLRSMPSMQATNSGEGDTIININILDENRTVRIKTGITEEQWGKLALAVVETGKFSRDTCKLAFGTEIGNEIYNLVHRKLFDAGVLYEYGNGYKVTEHIGAHFFQQLKKGDAGMLKLVKAPYPPLE